MVLLGSPTENNDSLFWLLQRHKLQAMRACPQFQDIDKRRFYRRWKRQYLRGLKAIGKQLERCRKTGDADAVHELRVAIRRTRLLALVGRSLIARKRALQFRAWAQQLADALSSVRDYDVMIEWANGISEDRKFLQALHKDRRAAWRDARPSLKRMPQSRWERLRRLKGGASKRRKLVARYTKISMATREIIEVDAKCFDRLGATQRHDLRRAVRRFKYLQELEKKPGRSEALGELQSGLGELQNAEAMKGLLQNGHRQRNGKQKLMRSVKRHEAEWYPRCHRSIQRVVNWP